MTDPLREDEFYTTVRNLAVHSPFCAYTRGGQECDCGLRRLLATLDARAALAAQPSPSEPDLVCNCENGDGTSPARYHADDCPIRTGSASPSEGPLDALSLLGYLWTAIGNDGRTRVCDLFSESDPLVADVDRVLAALGDDHA